MGKYEFESFFLLQSFSQYAFMSWKGQSSIEMTMVVAMAMTMSMPFIYASQSSVIELDDASKFLTLENSFDKLRSNLQDVEKSHYPARRTFEFKTPQDVEKIYQNNFGNESAIIFETRSRGNRVNRSLYIESIVNLKHNNELKVEGLHELAVRKTNNDEINITVIS